MPPSTFDVNWLQVQPQRFPGCQFAWFRPLQSILPGGTFGSTAAPYMYEIDSSFPQLACLAADVTEMYMYAGHSCLFDL